MLSYATVTVGTTQTHPRPAITFPKEGREISSKVPARIEWAGDSHAVLRSFPEAVRENLGYALYLVQVGEQPPDSRRMESIGPGVFELRDRDPQGWYRLIYLTRIGSTIHVLHCFRKKSRKTDRRDLEMARRRRKQVLAKAQS